MVVRRGEGVDYVEKQRSPYLLRSNMRRDFTEEATHNDGSSVT